MPVTEIQQLCFHWFFHNILGPSALFPGSFNLGQAKSMSAQMTFSWVVSAFPHGDKLQEIAQDSARRV